VQAKTLEPQPALTVPRNQPDAQGAQVRWWKGEKLRTAAILDLEGRDPEQGFGRRPAADAPQTSTRAGVGWL
jgi:hypothetical protein